jgi:hypothetical protein
VNALADASGGALIDAKSWTVNSPCSQRREPCLLLSRCSMLPGGDAHPRPCRDSSAGMPPRNTGRRYPAAPPTDDEIVAVIAHARHATHGDRLNGLIVASGAPGCGSTRRWR